MIVFKQRLPRLGFLFFCIFAFVLAGSNWLESQARTCHDFYWSDLPLSDAQTLKEHFSYLKCEKGKRRHRVAFKALVVDHPEIGNHFLVLRDRARLLSADAEIQWRKYLKMHNGVNTVLLVVLISVVLGVACGVFHFGSSALFDFGSSGARAAIVLGLVLAIMFSYSVYYQGRHKAALVASRAYNSLVMRVDIAAVNASHLDKDARIKYLRESVDLLTADFQRIREDFSGNYYRRPLLQNIFDG